MKVLCVKLTMNNPYFEGADLEVGKIYTVTGESINPLTGNPHYELAEMGVDIWYKKEQFKPVDNSFADEIIHSINEQIEEEHLVTI